jgi:hypothetical protein
MDSILVRVNRAAESILENESLTADLDDEAAKVLLGWGVARAKEITYRTIEILDEMQAEEAVYLQMRALRRILRTVNKWVAKANANEIHYGESALNKIILEAGIMYGPSYKPPDENNRQDILNRQNILLHSPAVFIAYLLNSIGKEQSNTL